MKTIVIFSGAGLSKESGIPTFRDSLNGLWENYKIEEVASRAGWVLYQRILASISGSNPGPLMDADGPLMEQPTVPVVDLAPGWQRGFASLPKISSTSKIINYHST
jgi:hypothetical protein